MLKKYSLKVLIVAMIVVSLATDSLAQQTRIRFAKGRTAATMTGAMAAGGSRAYVINVGRGQTMTVQVTGGSRIDLDVDGPDGHIEYGNNGFSQVEIYRTGDHYITISNSGRAPTKFNLTVTVR
jgi:hypothetical protein